MPRFSYSNVNFGTPPVGVYVAQVVRAKKGTSKKSGNEMIALNLSTLPDGYSLKYYLVFNGANDGLVCQFCQNCEGELTFPADPKDDYSLTAADILFRIAFVDVVHEKNGDDEPWAKIRLGGVVSRVEALARNPGLANIKLPANVPPPKALAILPKEEKPSKPGLPDDDVPF
jgi:hypothetical protein